MAGCPSQKVLFALLDGRLPRADATAARIHLESCGFCGPAFERMKRVRSALRDLGERAPVPAEENLVTEAKVMQAVQVRGVPRGTVQWWWLPVRAAATLAIALVVFPRLRGGGAEPAGAGPSAATAAGAGSGAAAGGIATVLAVRGAAEAGSDPEALHEAHAGDALSGGSVVRCGDGCEENLELASGGTLTLRPGTEIVLPDERDGLIRLVSGSIRVSVVPRPEGRRPFGVETPAARVEAVGTEFEVAHVEGTTSVEVFEGRVRFVSLASEEERLVAAGVKARIGESGQVEAGETVAGATPPELGEEPGATVPPSAIEAPQETPTEGSPAEAPPVQVRRPHGTIDGGAVRARVSRQRGALQACYNDYTLRLNPVALQVRVKFVVEEDGSVGGTDIALLAQDESPIEDEPLRSCIDHVFRAIRFPRPCGGPAQVFYPLSLSL